MKETWSATGQFAGHKGAVYALANSGPGHGFISAGGDGLVVDWDLQDPDQGVVLTNANETIFSLHLDRGRNVLLIGTGSGKLVVIDLVIKAEVQVVELHRKGIFRILPTASDLFVCAGGDGILSTWQWTDTPDVNARDRVVVVRQIPLCDEKLRDLALSPKGDRLAVACGDGTVRELDTDSFNELSRSTGHEKGSTTLTYHPTKPILISGGKDGQLRLWRTDGTEAPLLSWPAHKGAIYAATIDPNGRWLATAGRDSLVKIWDASTLEPIQRSSRDRTGHTHSVNAAIWCGNTLITASDDRTIRSWTPTP